MTNEDINGAINYLKSYRKLDENLHNMSPKDSVAYFATDKCLKYWDMAIKALEQESCDDAISRQALDEIKELMTDINGDTVYAVRMSDIRQLPSVNPQEPSETIHGSTYGGVSWGGTYKPQEPKTGHWIKTISENGITSAVRCSECGFEDNRYMLFTYCPNCGAKM